jgi:hypothetical protein
VTAFVTHGQHADSKLMDFGFAHNTPSNKRKLKLALNAAADGDIPLLYQTWSGRTADQATVETNLNNLAAWLQKRGKPLRESLIVGDRAMLNAELALLYDKFGLRHLTGLKAASPQLKALIGRWSDEQIETFPLVEGSSPQYWGRTCEIPFEHEGKCTTHKGLVVVAGPLRDQWRQARETQLQELESSLEQLSREIGQPRLRSDKAVLRRVNARVRNSSVGQFLSVTVNTTLTGEVNLFWDASKQRSTRPSVSMVVICWSPMIGRSHPRKCFGATVRRMALKNAFVSARAICRCRPSTSTRTNASRPCSFSIGSPCSPTPSSSARCSNGAFN